MMEDRGGVSDMCWRGDKVFFSKIGQGRRANGEASNFSGELYRVANSAQAVVTKVRDVPERSAESDTEMQESERDDAFLASDS